MQIYEAPMACTVDFEVVNVIATSNEETDVPDELVCWGTLVENVDSRRIISK